MEWSIDGSAPYFGGMYGRCFGGGNTISICVIFFVFGEMVCALVQRCKRPVVIIIPGFTCGRSYMGPPVIGTWMEERLKRVCTRTDMVRGKAANPLNSFALLLLHLSIQKAQRIVKQTSCCSLSQARRGTDRGLVELGVTGKCCLFLNALLETDDRINNKDFSNGEADLLSASNSKRILACLSIDDMLSCHPGSRNPRSQ